MMEDSKMWSHAMNAIVCIFLAATCRSASAQDLNDQELARVLVDDNTRPSAVTRIVASGSVRVPLLLMWTRTPPPQLNEYEQYKLEIGLAEVFGRLKTKEAIPFLIKNISLERWPRPNIWIKTPEVIEGHLPAAAALIKIGREALAALIHDSWWQKPPDDRLPTIFVVSRIGATLTDTDEVRGFLASVLGRANEERHWAEWGLMGLDSRR
jgi:hypothetical protein